MRHPNSHSNAVVLLKKKQKCRRIHTDACKLHTTHTHSHSYSCVLHPNAPWGTLVLPPSSIWETIHDPGEKREYEQVSAALHWDRKKTLYKSDKDSRQHHRLFSHKYLRPWHYIPSHIMLIDRHKFFTEIHNNPTMLSFNQGKLHSRDGKRRWQCR